MRFQPPPYTVEPFVGDNIAPLVQGRTVIANHGLMYRSCDCVWLASRSAESYYTPALYALSMDENGNVIDSDHLVSYSIENEDDPFPAPYGVQLSNGVRPVVTLKANLTVTGSGTQADPYIINESNPSQYTVTYCANGGYGEMNPQSVAQGNSLTLATNAYGHHGLSFLGWSTSATATTATYTNGQTITPTVDITLYAIWQ